MTLKQAIDRARSSLSANNIEDALLESELLLRHVLKISQTQLYLDIDRELSPKREKTFRNLIRRRLKGEPTAYITGHREFYGLDFRVNPDVLIPRPESELLVEKALQIARHHSLATIAEIGTGCGAIAISLAINLPQAKIYATDISAPALKVARANCQKHGVTRRVHLLPGNMLDPLPETVDLIVANLPYIKESELPVYFPVSLEPVLALNGGPDGLDKIRQLCRQLNDKLRPGGYLLLEMGQGQQKAVTTLLSRLFPSAQIEVIPDLSSIDRVVSLHLTKPSPPASGQ
jgi:release factor glutamine methyltransferase